MHDITFDVTFDTDPTKGGVNGQNLWKVKAYLSMSDDTASTASTPIAEAYAVLPGSYHLVSCNVCQT